MGKKFKKMLAVLRRLKIFFPKINVKTWHTISFKKFKLLEMYYSETVKHIMLAPPTFWALEQPKQNFGI